MHLLKSSIIFGLTLVWALSICITTASAWTVAGLQVDFADHLDPRLQDEIQEELDQLLTDSHRYDWIGVDDVIDALDGQQPDCFESQCLVDYGQRLGARVGLRVRIDEEAQFYDWVIDFYDLHSGDLLAREEGTCELCGRAEVVQQFRTSMQANLALLDLGDREPAEPIEPRVALGEGITELRVSVVPDDTRIFLDEEPIGVGEASIELDEGTYELRLSHDEHRGLSETIIVSSDSAPLFILRIHLADAPGAQRRVITRGDGFVDRIENRRVLIGSTALGVGTGLTIASFILAGLHGQPACSGDVPLQRCPDVYRTAGLATTTTIVGTLAVASGIALIAWPWLAGKQNEPLEGSVDITPSLGSDFTGLSVNGRF